MNKHIPLFLALAGACASTPAPPPAAPAPPGDTIPAPAAKAPAPAPAPVAFAEKYRQRCKKDLASVRELVAKAAGAKERTVDSVLLPLNDAILLVRDLEGSAEAYGLIHPDADTRAAADACTEETQKVKQELLQQRPLYDAISGVSTQGLDADTKRFVDHTLRDFRRAGVDKDEKTRARLQELNQTIVAAGLDWDKNIRDDVRREKFDAKELDGLPADYIAAHRPGADGKVEITTDYPDYFPFRSYVKSNDARKRMTVAFMSRGWPQNDEPLRRMVTARREYAQLLGYKDWADYATEDKMMKSGKNAQEFIDKVSGVAEKRARADLAILLARKKKDDPKAKQVTEWERYYYEDLVKREKYNFDTQSVRPYFEYNQTRDGLLAITGKLFGVEYKKVTDAEVWHPDVEVYDVYRKGEKLGRVFLDMFPRENKYKHAAQGTLVNGMLGRQLPEGVLMCNLPNPKTSSGPALMVHDDVKTMFHEFGHLLHHILGGKQKWAAFSGVSTEWDFVEAPSQMLENWILDPEALAIFARHVETKEPIPADLVKRMREASEFAEGIEVRRQMFLAAISLRFHTADPKTLDFSKMQKELQAKYHMFPYVDGTHFYAAFTHLAGYSAIYYTYTWSKVIARDLFSEFQKKGLFDAETATRYRDDVLVPGGSKDAADLVKDFLGRPYSFEAYRRWLEGA